MDPARMRQLYTFFRSSTSYRLRIALALKGLEYQAHYISLPKMDHRSADYLEVNPQGLLPTLVEDDGTVLTQSLAMLEYLDEAYPEPRLVPSDLRERAYVRALSQIIACEIHPLNNVRVLKWLGTRWELTEAEVNEWYAHWVADGFRAFEATLQQEGRSGIYCLDDRLTLADICLVPQVANARRFKCDLSPYPRLVAIADAALALPAFQAADPAKQADAF
jgi:maleylacetoacetate isomerase